MVGFDSSGFAGFRGLMQVNKDTDVAASLGLGESGPRAGGPGRWLVASLVVMALAGAVLLWLGLDHQGAAQYRTAVAQRGDLTVTVTATGSVQPTNDVEISSELSGIIRTVAVDYNDRVEVGQVLAELDCCLDPLFGGDAEQISCQCDGVSPSVALEAMEDASGRCD